MPSVANRVKETSTTTGTGNLTLSGAATGFETFNAAFGLNVAFSYVIDDGTNWEIGEGYLSSSTVLVRSVVESSSNADALVNFGAGTKNVACTIPASVVWGRGKALSSAMRLVNY